METFSEISGKKIAQLQLCNDDDVMIPFNTIGVNPSGASKEIRQGSKPMLLCRTMHTFVKGLIFLGIIKFVNTN